MLCLFLIILAFVPSLASKEHMPLQNLPEDEKHILFELIKRLEKGRDNEIGWKEQSQCDVSTNKNAIIKRVDSEKNGAKFLTIYKNTETNGACSDLCCKNESCDLAVYENKGDNYCYLFKCDGKCKFGHHLSYISNNISHNRISQSEDPLSMADGSELDLINLDKGLDSHLSGIDRKDSFLQTTVATTVSSTTVYIRAHSVGLEGPYCELDLHCEDPNAVCTDSKCQCQEGFYQKEHICRKVCPSSNFECLELGTLGRGPQCVSDVQVCDSVMQCADGSDEFNCPDTGMSPVRTWQQQQQMPLAHATQQSLQNPQQHQQAFPQDEHGEPRYSYNEQGVMVPSAASLGQSNNHGSIHSFPRGQTFGKDGSSSYTGYSSRPEQSHQLPLFENPGQLPVNSQKSLSQQYPPLSNSRPENIGNSQFTGKEKPEMGSKGPGSFPEQSVPARQQQPSAMQPTDHLDAPAQGQPLSRPQHVSQDDLKQYPQQSMNTVQKVNSNQPLAKPDLEQPQQDLKSKHPYTDSQNNKGFVGYKENKPLQPYKNSHPQSYQPSKSKQYAASRTKVDVQNQGQTDALSKSPRPSHPDKSDLPPSDQSQLEKGRIFTEGHKPNAIPVDSANQGVSKQTQDLPSQNLPSDPKAQKTISSAVHTAESKPSVKSGSVATVNAQGSHLIDASSHPTDSQKAYIISGHSKMQNKPESYNPPHIKTDLEQQHPHSAYDVRIAAPIVDGHKSESRQQSFLNPTEMNDLDSQGSHYLDGFGDQFLPQQGFAQYNPFNRYPNTYAQNPGSRGNSYQGIPDQLYPGSQSQRLYPQQGYLDFGYPPQYEFGELDPAYSESDNFPGNHDVPAYRPDSKLGYDGLYLGQGVLSKDDKGTHHSDEGSSDNSPKSKISTQAVEDVKQVEKENKSDEKSKQDANHVSSSSLDANDTNPNKDSNTLPDKLEEGKLDTDDHAAVAESKTPDNTDVSGKEETHKSEVSQTDQGKEVGKSKGTQDLVQHQGDITQIKLDLPAEPANMQGPIIALSLGLAFTVILLVFVACRLRNVRRRLRKGRPLHSNEADYLINGMYL